MRKSKLKKLLPIGLTVLLFIFSLLQSNANDIAKGADLPKLSQAKITSIEVPVDIRNAALNYFPNHMYSIFQDPAGYGYTAEEVAKFTLGNPFNIYQYRNQEVSNTGIYYFPILIDGKIRATLGMAKGEGMISITYSPGFAKELQQVLDTATEPIRVFTTNGEVRAITSKEDIMIGTDDHSPGPLTLTRTDIDKINELATANVRAGKYNEVTSYAGSVILSNEVPEEIKNEARNVFSKHLYSILQNPSDYGYTAEEVRKFTLGNPFNIYQYRNQEVSDTGIYYFPVLADGEIRAMLAVAKAGGTMSSTFSPGFAKELQRVLSTVDEPFRLFTTNGEVRAITSKADDMLGAPGHGSEPPALSETDIDKINALAAANVNAGKYDEVTSYRGALDQENNAVKTQGTAAGLINDRYLHVPILLQEDKALGWADAMASMLNYAGSGPLTPHDTTVKVKGSYVNGPASILEVRSGYTKYGLNPFIAYDLTSTQMAACLRINKPCHSFWELMSDPLAWHSMVICGYALYADGVCNYRLMDPRQGYISVVGHVGNTAQTTYVYSGEIYQWERSMFI